MLVSFTSISADAPENLHSAMCTKTLACVMCASLPLPRLRLRHDIRPTIYYTIFSHVVIGGIRFPRLCVKVLPELARSGSSSVGSISKRIPKLHWRYGATHICFSTSGQHHTRGFLSEQWIIKDVESHAFRRREPSLAIATSKIWAHIYNTLLVLMLFFESLLTISHNSFC